MMKYRKLKHSCVYIHISGFLSGFYVRGGMGICVQAQYFSITLLSHFQGRANQIQGGRMPPPRPPLKETLYMYIHAYVYTNSLLFTSVACPAKHIILCVYKLTPLYFCCMSCKAYNFIVVSFNSKYVHIFHTVTPNMYLLWQCIAWVAYVQMVSTISSKVYQAKNTTFI